MNSSDFDEIYRELDRIFDSEDEQLVQILEDVVDEAYDATTHGKTLPADWLLRVATRIRAVKAKSESVQN
jgi:hypothetical protein